MGGIRIKLKNTKDLEENKGYELIEEGKYQEAIEYSDKILESNPKDVKAWNIKGNALKELGKYHEAVECYDKSLELDPNDAKVWNDKGNALFGLWKSQKTVDYCKELLDVDPDFIKGWHYGVFYVPALERYPVGYRML